MGKSYTLKDSRDPLKKKFFMYFVTQGSPYYTFLPIAEEFGVTPAALWYTYNSKSKYKNPVSLKEQIDEKLKDPHIQALIKQWYDQLGLIADIAFKDN